MMTTKTTSTQGGNCSALQLEAARRQYIFNFWIYFYIVLSDESRQSDDDENDKGEGLAAHSNVCVS